MIANAMPTKNKKKVICFLEKKQLEEINSKALQEGVPKSVILRRLLEYAIKNYKGEEL
mgnify:CR=1 FL=1